MRDIDVMENELHFPKVKLLFVIELEMARKTDSFAGLHEGSFLYLYESEV